MDTVIPTFDGTWDSEHAVLPAAIIERADRIWLWFVKRDVEPSRAPHTPHLSPP
jgi:hypothetical protein